MQPMTREEWSRALIPSTKGRVMACPGGFEELEGPALLKLPGNYTREQLDEGWKR